MDRRLCCKKETDAGGTEMDTAMIFAILGIEETKDEEQIRQAYRMQLAQNNPEDDPEGFRRLREAYEQAMVYARESNEEIAGEEEDTPIGRWLKRAEDIYFCLPKRLDAQVWQELLRDEICVDLEYAEEAKWRLFRFFTDHYRLNSQIYRILDEFFEIQEGEKELKEHLPIAFVDYMIRKIQDTEGDDDFPYQWIEGADTADYDEFQDRLYELEELLSEGKEKEADQVVTVMEQLGITHPYYRLAKARLAALKGDPDATLVAKKLIEDYQENMKIQVLSAEVLWDCNEKETAAAVFQRIHEEFGIFFIVEKYLAFYKKEQGNLVEAIEHCLEALRKANDETLERLQEELDAAYIEKCKEELLEGTLTLEDAERVCKAYVRSQRFQEGIDFILGHPEYIEQIENIHSSLSVLYYRAEKYEESVQESRVWRELLLTHIEEIKKRKEEKATTEQKIEKQEEEAVIEQGAKEQEKETITEQEVEYTWNLAVSYSYEGLALRMLAKRDAEEGKSEGYTYQEAKQAWEKALEYAPGNPNMKQDLLDLLIDEGSYEKAVELADELLAWNREWFPALVQKQKACYELGRAQEVVDLFYQAKEVYAEYAQIYELAVQIFCDYKQFQDAEGILEQAEKAEVQSFGLDLAALRCERMQCRTDVSFFEAVKKAEELLKKFEEGNAKKKELSALYFEMSILEDCQYYQGFMHPGKAEEYIKKAIELRAHEPVEEVAPYYYTYGNILQNAEKYEEALEAYQTYVGHGGMTEMAAMNLARCYDKIGEWENAIRLYQKAISINPDQKDANGKIAAIYKREGDKRNSVPLIQKALPYEDRQIEILPESAYHYRVRGIIYKMLGNLEKALEDTEKAIRLDKKNPYGLNLKGRILYYMGKYQQALFFYKKSIANLKDPKADGWAMYTNAAESCQKMGDYEQAEEWYRKGIALFEGKDQAWCYWELVRIYKEQRRYQEALQILEESFEKGNMKEERYLLRCFGIKEALCQSIEQAQELEHEAWEAAQKFDSVDTWEEVSDIQYYYLLDKKRGIETKEMVMKRLEAEDGWWNHKGKLIERMQICWELGKKQEVEKWGKIYIQAIEGYYCFDTEEYPATEQYINDPNDAYENLCDMIQYWIFTGQMELAKEGIERARGMKKCRDCRQCDCIELEETEAIYLEAMGEDLQAYRRYCEIYKRCPSSSLAYYKMQTLGK